MDRKGFSHVEIKAADKGQVEAVFSTFNVKDLDGDVTLPGAFQDGAPVRISAFNHDSWGSALPVGKGTIHTTKTEAFLDGQFFLDTAAGRDTFTTVKELGDLQEWSYGYDVVGSSYGQWEGQEVQFLNSLKVYEVSPVLVGAGIGTRTLSAKSAGLKFSDEATQVLASVTGLVNRAADVMAIRSEKGKGLSAESADLLGHVEAELKRLAELLRAEPTPDNQKAVEALASEYARFLSL
jgi:HK97 family phage prohead protease